MFTITKAQSEMITLDSLNISQEEELSLYYKYGESSSLYFFYIVVDNNNNNNKKAKN